MTADFTAEVEIDYGPPAWRRDTPGYRAWYTRGWDYSRKSPAPTLDHLDAGRWPEPAYDGYLDHAAGREKWHTLTCRDRHCPH